MEIKKLRYVKLFDDNLQIEADCFDNMIRNYCFKVSDEIKIVKLRRLMASITDEETTKELRPFFWGGLECFIQSNFIFDENSCCFTCESFVSNLPHQKKSWITKLRRK